MSTLNRTTTDKNCIQFFVMRKIVFFACYTVIVKTAAYKATLIYFVRTGEKLFSSGQEKRKFLTISCWFSLARYAHKAIPKICWNWKRTSFLSWYVVIIEIDHDRAIDKKLFHGGEI